MVFLYSTKEKGQGVKFLAQCYSVSEMYGGVRSTAYRRREKILEDIVKWDKMYGDSCK
jgi:hypothetical protein